MDQDHEHDGVATENTLAAIPTEAELRQLGKTPSADHVRIMGRCLALLRRVTQLENSPAAVGRVENLITLWKEERARRSQVLGQLFDNLRLLCRRQFERSQTLSNFVLPLRHVRVR